MGSNQDNRVRSLRNLRDHFDEFKEFECKEEFSFIDLDIDRSSVNFLGQISDGFISNFNRYFLERISSTCRKYWPSYYDSFFRIRFEQVDVKKFLASGEPEDLYSALPQKDKNREIVLYVEMDHCPPCDKIRAEVFSSSRGYQLTHPAERADRIAIRINEKDLSPTARRNLFIKSFPVFITYSPKENRVIRQARVYGYENEEKFQLGWSKAEKILYGEKEPIDSLKEQIAQEKAKKVPHQPTIYDLQVELATRYLEEGKAKQGLPLLNQISQALNAQPTNKNCAQDSCLESDIWSAPAFKATRVLFSYYRVASSDYYNKPEFYLIASKLENRYQWFSPIYLNHADALFRRDTDNPEKSIDYLVERWKPSYKQEEGDPPFIWDLDPENLRLFFIGSSRFIPKNIDFIDRLLNFKSIIRVEVVAELMKIRREMEKESAPFRAKIQSPNAS